MHASRLGSVRYTDLVRYTHTRFFVCLPCVFVDYAAGCVGEKKPYKILVHSSSTAAVVHTAVVWYTARTEDPSFTRARVGEPCMMI